MRLSLALGVLPLLLLAPGTALRQDQKVTYSTEAKTADVVLGDLAAKTGLDLHWTPDAKSHVLIINVKDVPAKDLIERIAKTMSSHAVSENGVWTISPDIALRKKEEADVIARREKNLIDAQAAISKMLDAKQDPQKPSFSMINGADSRALAKLVLLLDPNQAGTLGEGGRIVFSTSPNAMQRPMRGPKVAEIFQTLFQEHNAEIDDAGPVTLGGANEEEMRELEQFYGRSFKPRKFEEVPSKAILVLETKSDSLGVLAQSPTAVLKVYDKKGEVVAMSSLNLNPDYFNMMTKAAADIDEKEPESAKKEAEQSQDPADAQKVELSKKSKAFISSIASADMNFNITPELKGYLADPVTNDPLSFVTTDSLVAIAKAKNLNVVANMPDTALMESGGFLFGGATDLTVGTALQEMTSADSLDVTNADGWLTIVPKDPVSARDYRQDRGALKALIDSVEKNGSLTLDAMTQFAVASPSPTQNFSTMPYLLVFAPSAFSGAVNGQMSWDMLRFYANLTPPIRKSLRDGQRVPFSSLSTAARGILSNMSFGADSNIVPAEKLKEQKSSVPWFMTMFGAMGGLQEKTYVEEPTEVMPKGLPNGFIEMSVSNGPVLRQTSEQRNLFLSIGAMTPEDLAFFELLKDQSPEFDLGIVGGADAAKIMQRETLSFHFWLTDLAGLDKTLFNDSLDPNAKEVSLTNLPPDFRALIEKAKVQMKQSPIFKMLTRATGGGGGGGGG